ncbi:MAG: hypothetical protein ACRDTG_16355 [Pseudonocardiaceae bacterium]
MGDTTRNSAGTEESVHPADKVIFQSRMPRVSVCGTRYGHGLCTILWIKVNDDEWVLLPHGVPSLAVHLSTGELTTMLDRLREKL